MKVLFWINVIVMAALDIAPSFVEGMKNYTPSGYFVAATFIILYLIKKDDE